MTPTSMLGRLLLIAVGVLGARVASADTVTYYHADALGTPVMESAANGSVTYQREHRPFGEQVASIAAPKDGPGFSGHVGDLETGLTYMQARYYDPVTGRFLSSDPIGVDPGSGSNFNRYAYANNNPYGFVDPDGLQTKKPEHCETIQCHQERQKERQSRADAPFTGGTFKRAEYSGKQLEERMNENNYVDPADIAKTVDEHSKDKTVGQVVGEVWVGGRYVYTKKLGWIDLKHVTVSAMIPNAHGFVAGIGWEESQKIAYPSSAYAIEDLNSNFIGSIVSARREGWFESRSLGEIAASAIEHFGGAMPLDQVQRRLGDKK